MIIFRQTLLLTLHRAVEHQEELEKGYGYTLPSAYLATIREMKVAVENGETIELRD